jgi:hypothetical protein
MYRLFTLYWSGQRAMGFMDAHLRFTAMTAPALIDPGLLPQEYVAVKFYAARSLPDTPEIRAHLRATVTALSERLPVVLLDTGLVLEDDHADYTFATRGRVMSARPPKRSSARAAVSPGWRRVSALIPRGCMWIPSGCMRTSRWRCARITG